MKFVARWIFVFLCLALSACEGGEKEMDTAIVGNDLVADVQFALATSIYSGNEADTRMSRENTQADGQFRGLDYLHFIPFASGASVHESDVSLAPGIRYFTMQNDNDATGAVHLETNIAYTKWSYSKTLYSALSMPYGTQSFLVYGHPEGGGQSASVANKFAMGSLKVEGLVVPVDQQLSVEDINFTPDLIYADPVSNSSNQNTFDKALNVARQMVEYLNYVADAPYTPAGSDTPLSWKNAPDGSNAKAQFDKFIHGNRIFTLPVASFAALLKDIYESLEPADLKSAFLERANGNSKSDHPYKSYIEYKNNAFNFKGDWSKFPNTGNLPSGLFVFKWLAEDDDPRFVLLTSDDTFLDPGILKKELLAYPAQLWYFNNSPLHSKSSMLTEGEINSIIYSNPWSSDGFNGIFNDTMVKMETRSVVIDNPLGYGVSLLQVNAHTPNSLKYKGVEIPADAIHFKGIMVTHQHRVGYDFQPNDNSFHVLYDNNIKNGRGNNFTLSKNLFDRNLVNILTLPSYPREDVYVIAEFIILKSKINQTFRNEEFEIYPDTPFYMVAKLDPNEVPANSLNSNNRQVFISDKRTKVTLMLNSLDGAYNYVPDVRSPSLKLGMEIELDWEQADPSTLWMN